MNDEFITKAIENDRYLKAFRLVDRFETEIEGELRRVANEFVSGSEALFDDDADQNFDLERYAEQVIAIVRVNTRMNRVRSAEYDNQDLWLNTTLRWLDPAEYGLLDVDGALCVTAYKINYAGDDDYDRVKRQTAADDWLVNFCRDAYENAPGMVYVPVESAAEIHAGFDTLKEHFWTYGAEYGVDPDSVT